MDFNSLARALLWELKPIFETLHVSISHAMVYDFLKSIFAYKKLRLDDVKQEIEKILQIQNEEVNKKIIDYLTPHKLPVNGSILYESSYGGEIALKGYVSSLTPNTSIIIGPNSDIKLTGKAFIKQNG